jgi:hypothetical protein
VPAEPEVQLVWFSTALEELTAFLRSADVFRPLHHPPSGMALDLSLGALLLAADALTAFADDLAPAQRLRWDQGRRRWETQLASHAAAIDAKAVAELPHRLNLWRAYLQDLAEKAAEAAAYPTEVRHRVIISRLLEGLRDARGDASRHQLQPLDQDLRQRAESAPFVWAPALARVYPPESYWFLYLRLLIPLGRTPA